MNTGCDNSPALAVAYGATNRSFARILFLSLTGLLMAAPPAAAQATDLSSLAARVIDAVVNISTTVRADEATPGGQPQRSGGADSSDRPNERPSSEGLRSSLGSGF